MQIIIVDGGIMDRIRLDGCVRAHGWKNGIMTATNLDQLLGWLRSARNYVLPLPETRLVLVTGCRLEDKDLKLLSEVATTTTAPVWLVCGEIPPFKMLEMLDVIGVKVVDSKDLGNRLAEAGMLE